jgi:hypothetical protein
MNIIELAKQAGLDWASGWTLEDDEPNRFETFAKMVAAQEREECAKLVHEGTGEPIQTKTLFVLNKERKRIADAIRARGTT